MMTSQYELEITLYRCARCGTSLRVESDSFYWFSGPDDPEFWCPSCEDLPIATLVGIPAQDLPEVLSLPRGFALRPVPDIESDNARDIEEANQLYRPYTKRNFLSQYQKLLQQGGLEATCHQEPSTLRPTRFDPQTQRYVAEREVRIEDKCSGSVCQFLQAEVFKPVESTCLVIKELCQIQSRSRFGLCQTGDEAQILGWYLLLTGGIHCPMLIPQASIFSGERRPDFLCYLPISRFQYHPVAVLVDRPGKARAQTDSEDRYYRSKGFKLKRIGVDGATSHYKLARELKLWLEGESC